MPPTATSDRVGRVLIPLGGCLAVASAFVPWIGQGAGSTVALHDLGDLVLGGTVSSMIPRWVGLAAYLIPALGAAIVLLAGLHGRPARRAVVALTAVLAVLVVAAIVLPLARDRRPDLGQLLAALGVLAIGAGLPMTASEDGSVPSIR